MFRLGQRVKICHGLLTMRILVFLICFFLTCPLIHAQALSETERKALIDELTKIKDAADQRVDARFRAAMTAYSQAMASNEAVTEFYLKCVEKVNFANNLKEPKDFREWKEKQATTIADPAFRLALRYQIRWLCLILEATSKNANKERLATEAASFVDTIFSDFSAIQTQSSVIRQSVMGTVFAKAYQVDSVAIKWPTSPVDVGGIYEKIIFPNLRNPTLTANLRNAWIKRIQLEKVNACSWVDKKTDVTTKDGRRDREKEREIKESILKEQAVKEERFETKTKLEFIWQMELDLFKNGQEVDAATRMLSHIKNHINHPSSRKWTEQLQQLLSPQAEPVDPTLDPSSDSAPEPSPEP